MTDDTPWKITAEAFAELEEALYEHTPLREALARVGVDLTNVPPEIPYSGPPLSQIVAKTVQMKAIAEILVQNNAFLLALAKKERAKRCQRS